MVLASECATREGSQPSLGALPVLCPELGRTYLTSGPQGSRCGWTPAGCSPAGPPLGAGLSEPVQAPARPLCPAGHKLHEQEHKEESLRPQQLGGTAAGLQEAERRRVEEEKERSRWACSVGARAARALLSLLLSKKADEPRHCCRAGHPLPGPAAAGAGHPAHRKPASAGAAPGTGSLLERPAAL